MIPRHNQLTIGQLIDLLEKRPPKQVVLFDFGDATCPTSVSSYRGYYEDLALGHRDDIGAHDKTVEELVAQLDTTAQMEHHGYKGGTYQASRDSNLWVANWGESTERFVTGVADGDGVTVLVTAVIPPSPVSEDE